MSNQQSNKRGKQSTAQKRDSSRHDFEPIPATSKVGGASGGNQPTGRTVTQVMDHYTEEEMQNRSSEVSKPDQQASTDEE
jgi:hypothetical protein